jgi:hypothetical protein
MAHDIVELSRCSFNIFLRGIALQSQFSKSFSVHLYRNYHGILGQKPGTGAARAVRPIGPDSKRQPAFFSQMRHHWGGGRVKHFRPSRRLSLVRGAFRRRR